jgi:multidrug efflux pump subunit AcrA (membrane-fusion protein)
LGTIREWVSFFLSPRWGVIFRRLLKELLSPIMIRWKPRSEEKSDQATVAPSKIKLPKLTLPKRARWGLGLAGLTAVLCLCRMELKISGPFTVLPLHNADVRAGVEGIIEEIYAEEGDFVDKGAPLGRLSGRDYRADLRKTRAETEAKQAQLKLLKAGPRAQEIAVARTQVAKSEERLRFSRDHLESQRDRVLNDVRPLHRA